MTTITYAGGVPMEPILALTSSYSSTRASRSVVHDILGGAPVVTLRPAGPRSGKLELLFPDEASAHDAAEAHSLAAVFTLTDSTRPTRSMAYVVDGSVAVALDPRTLARWVLTVDFREVS